ncbi:MAG: type II toxin-antitoxin system HicB family antitoxin [Burkholderiaceae bacterium]
MSKWRFEDYAVEVRPLTDGEGGGFLATIPDLPGCMADGETQEEAIKDAKGAFEAWVGSCVEEGRPVPPPTTVTAASGRFVTRIPKSLHASLTARARAEGVSANALVATYIAAGLASGGAESWAGTRPNVASLFLAQVRPAETALTWVAADTSTLWVQSIAKWQAVNHASTIHFIQPIVDLQRVVGEASSAITRAQQPREALHG